MSKVKSWFEIRNLADEPTRAEVYLYDEIGGWGVSAREFSIALGALDVETIDLRINSPGGSVFEGMAIMNALRRHKARVEATVDGLAASAASFIAMAADHVVMNRGSELMIHEAWGWAQGDAKTMREMAVSLDKTSAAIAGVYAQRAGGDADSWREVMAAETWYSAEEAVLAGLADEWVDAPATSNSFDLSRFVFQGRAQAPAPRIEAVNGLPVTGRGQENKEEVVVALRDDLIEQLGLDAEAADEEILEAVIAAQSDGDEGDDGAAAAASVLPEGAVVMDEGVLAQLQADAAAGREALDAQAAARREGIVAVAVREGRVAPVSRDKWLAALAKDEAGTADLLASFPKNTIPVSELGASDDVMSAEDLLYAAAYGSSEKGA